MANKEKELWEALLILWKLRTRMNVLGEVKEILNEFVCENCKREECEDDEGDWLPPEKQGDSLMEEAMNYLKGDTTNGK
jgi:hypothetical protein